MQGHSIQNKMFYCFIITEYNTYRILDKYVLFSLYY